MNTGFGGNIGNKHVSSWEAQSITQFGGYVGTQYISPFTAQSLS